MHVLREDLKYSFMEGCPQMKLAHTVYTVVLRNVEGKKFNARFIPRPFYGVSTYLPIIIIILP